jgi:hypothetical protein
MKTNDLKYIFTHSTPRERVTVKASLSDECRNGYAYFSLTCSAKELRRGRWEDSFGGCAHDEILARFPDVPELRLLASVHLSESDGVPTHAFGNALYWFQGMFSDGLGATYHGGSGRDGKSAEKCREILTDHLRATPAQIETLIAAQPRNAAELQYQIEGLGLIWQWKAEADKLRKWLEEKTGNEYDYPAERLSYKPTTPEAAKAIEELAANGYYLPDNIAKRDAVKKRVQRRKLIAEAMKEANAKREHIRKELALRLCVIDCDNKAAKNVILYTHTDTVTANWSENEPLWAEADFNAFAAECKLRPELTSVKFEFQAKPKTYAWK